MNVQAALKGQYHAALAMLRAAIEQCPDDLWTAEAEAAAFWRVAYHTLYFADLYLQPDERAFRPCQFHRANHQYLGPLPWPPHDQPEIGTPYTKAQVLDYWRICDEMVDAAVDHADLDAAQCGFSWYALPKLDHQLNNIRHIQHHAALLSGRVRQATGVVIEWVGFE